MKQTLLKSSVAVALLGAAAFWYWSPYVALHQMRTAALARDADSFNNHVDYPKLRESLKTQLTAKMSDQLGVRTRPGAEPQAGGDIQAAASKFGSMLGTMIMDRMVDAIVRPEVVMRVMENGGMQKHPEEQDKSEPRKDAPRWTSSRAGLNKVIFYADNPEARDGDGAGLVLERQGLVSWKLTEVRLPGKTLP